MSRFAIARTAAFVAAVLACGTGTAAAQTNEPDTDGLVRVVHAAPIQAAERLTVSIDGDQNGRLAFGESTGFTRVGEGARRVSVTGKDGEVTKQTVEVRAGCRHTLVLAHSGGLRRDPQFLDAAECEPQRMPSGQAGVRLVNATADVGPIRLVPPGSPAVAPFKVSERLALPGGEVTLHLQSPTGERFASKKVELPPNTTWTMVYLGAGEVPLQTRLLFDGAQPAEPPDPNLPINTGIGMSSRPAPPFGAVLVAAAGMLLGVRFRRALRPLAAAVLLSVLATACGEIGQGAQGPPPASGEALTSTKPGVKQPAAPAGQVALAGPEPVQLAIPAIGLDAAVVGLPTPVATDPGFVGPAEVGWFATTSVPGSVGAAVLAGHISWGESAGAFGRLHELRRQDRVTVVDASDRSHLFVVRAVATYPKGALPPQLYAPTPEPTVVLVTCTGPVDPETGLHRDNLIVIATAPQL